MTSKRDLAVLVVVLLCVIAVTRAEKEAKVLHEWVVVEYDWDSIPISRDSAIQQGLFIPENNAVAGVKQWVRGPLFLLLFRVFSDADVSSARGSLCHCASLDSGRRLDLESGGCQERRVSPLSLPFL